MLAATPKNPNRANLFRLVLTLSSNRNDTPQTLVDYFDEVLLQARAISERHFDFSKEIIPEAIDIAVELKSNDIFSCELKTIDSYRKLTPELAASLLRHLEESPVY